MNFNPRSTISNMEDAYDSYNKAIDRVLDAWDDKVSEYIQANTINHLLRVGTAAIHAFASHTRTIEILLDEMETYVKR